MESFGGENRLLTVLKDQLLTEDRITKYTDNRLRDVSITILYKYYKS